MDTEEKLSPSLRSEALHTQHRTVAALSHQLHGPVQGIRSSSCGGLRRRYGHNRTDILEVLEELTPSEETKHNQWANPLITEKKYDTRQWDALYMLRSTTVRLVLFAGYVHANFIHDGDWRRAMEP